MATSIPDLIWCGTPQRRRAGIVSQPRTVEVGASLHSPRSTSQSGVEVDIATRGDRHGLSPLAGIAFAAIRWGPRSVPHPELCHQPPIGVNDGFILATCGSKY